MNPSRDYYALIKLEPCLACGRYGTHENPIEAAHLRSVLSAKTGNLLPRSHKGWAGWGAIPLCKTCHHLQHQEGEDTWIAREVGWKKAQGAIIMNLLHYFSNSSSP